MNGNNISPGLTRPFTTAARVDLCAAAPSYALFVDDESDKSGRDGESLVLMALSILESLCLEVICNVTTAATGVGWPKRVTSRGGNGNRTDESTDETGYRRV
jgi:hypothetical protein